MLLHCVISLSAHECGCMCTPCAWSLATCHLAGGLAARQLAPSCTQLCPTSLGRLSIPLWPESCIRKTAAMSLFKNVLCFQCCLYSSNVIQTWNICERDRDRSVWLFSRYFFVCFCFFPCFLLLSTISWKIKQTMICGSVFEDYVTSLKNIRGGVCVFVCVCVCVYTFIYLFIYFPRISNIINAGNYSFQWIE